VECFTRLQMSNSDAPDVWLDTIAEILLSTTLFCILALVLVDLKGIEPMVFGILINFTTQLALYIGGRVKHFTMHYIINVPLLRNGLTSH